jgi:hypothetical protein
MIAASRLALLVLALTLAACGSAHKRGEKLLEAGNYDEAVAVYEDILRDNPKDEKAQIQLRTARTRALEQRLIAARKARQGGNPEQGLELVLETLQKAAAWRMPVLGNAAFTQEEEISAALPYAVQRVSDDLKADRPLRASWFLRRYDPLLRNDPQRRGVNLAKATADAGRRGCRKLVAQSSAERPHFARFAAAWCAFYGEAAPALAAYVATAKAEFYGALAFDPAAVQELQAARSGAFAAPLQQALERTGWYEAGGARRAALAPQGFFRQRRDTRAVPQTHVYEVQVPFTRMERVQREIAVEYEVEETQIDPAGGIRKVRVKRTRPELRWVDEPVQAVRKEERVHRFTGVEQRQELELKFAGGFELAGFTVPVDLQDRKLDEGVEHHENRPEMNLRPAVVKLTDPDAWLRTLAQRLADGVEVRLVEEWRRRHCAGTAEGTEVGPAGEAALRCVRRTTSPHFGAVPEFVERWYEQSFGVSRAQATELLGG